MLPVSELSTSLHSVAVATLSRLRDDPFRFRKYYLEAISTISLVAMPISAFLAVAGRDVVFILLGPKWERSAPLFTILALSAGIYTVYMTIEWLHVSLGRAERWFRWGLISFVVTMGGILIGIALHPKAVAAAYSIAIIVLIGPAIAYAGRPANLRFWDVLAVFWKYFVAAAVAGGACILGERTLGQIGALVRLFAFIGLFGTVYVTLVLLLHRGATPFRNFFRVLAALFRGAAAIQKTSGAEE
jgi:PST family polysaccharide transporter